MGKDFDARFTHAMLMAVIVLLTKNDGLVLGTLHGPLVISAAFVWAYCIPKLGPRST